MSVSSDRVVGLLQRITAWVGTHEDIRALALSGPRAPVQARPGPDIDLVLLVREPRKYLDDLAWTDTFGEVGGTLVEAAERLTSVRVYYEDGAEVTFGFAGTDWAGVPAESGLTVLSDRDGMFRHAGLEIA